MVQETFYYPCGDRYVAYALRGWIDTANIYNGANTDDFGFNDVSLTDHGAVITMNGIDIEIDKSAPKVTVFRFS